MSLELLDDGMEGRFLMTDDKVYNVQNADLVRLVCLGTPCRRAVPDHRCWLRPAIRSIRILLEAGRLDG